MNLTFTARANLTKAAVIRTARQQGEKTAVEKKYQSKIKNI